MNSKRLKILIALIFAVASVIGVNTFVYNNPRALYTIAEGLDEPSALFYWITERIYKLSRNDSEITRILSELELRKSEHMHDLYIRTIGIVGGNRNEAINYTLVKVYSRYQDDEQKKSIVATTVDSMGLIGNESTIAVLERLVANYENHHMVVAKYPVVRALYLSTGDIHRVKDKSSMDFSETAELKMIREVITQSNGRYRTFNEMLILSNLNKPDKFKWEGNV
jgi:hypothetical protein